MKTNTANLIIVIVIVVSGIMWYNLSYKKNGKEILEKIKTTKSISSDSEKRDKEIDSLKQEVEILKQQQYNSSGRNNQNSTGNNEPNYSRINKNRVQNHNDYVTGSDGKTYENKACYNCSGEGYTVFINPATGQKETNICNACNGVGQIGYEF